MSVEEEAQARREPVHVEAAAYGRLDVGDPVREREGDLLHGRAAGLAHVVARDRDRVPARNVLGAEAHEVRREAQRGFHREAVVPARRVLLEDVVLDGTPKLREVRPAAPREGDDVREQDRCRGVDRHRHRHLVERDVREEQLDVALPQDRVGDLDAARDRAELEKADRRADRHVLAKVGVVVVAGHDSVSCSSVVPIERPSARAIRSMIPATAVWNPTSCPLPMRCRAARP